MGLPIGPHAVQAQILVTIYNGPAPAGALVRLRTQATYTFAFPIQLGSLRSVSSSETCRFNV